MKKIICCLSADDFFDKIVEKFSTFAIYESVSMVYDITKKKIYPDLFVSSFILTQHQQKRNLGFSCKTFILTSFRMKVCMKQRSSTVVSMRS